MTIQSKHLNYAVTIKIVNKNTNNNNRFTPDGGILNISFTSLVIQSTRACLMLVSDDLRLQPRHKPAHG